MLQINSSNKDGELVLEMPAIAFTNLCERQLCTIRTSWCYLRTFWCCWIF